MADVAGKFYSASRTRQGVSVVSPGFESGEPQDPVNPPGSVEGPSTYIQLLDTNNTYQGQNGRVPIVDEVENRLIFGVLPNAGQIRLIFGGIVQWSGLGFVFNISRAVAEFNGFFVDTLVGDIITLDAADTVNDRIDVIFLDIDGNFGKLTGSPSVSPVKPQVNPLTQIELTSIIVQANSTTPIDTTTETVYDENTEWTVSFVGTGTGVSNSAVNPYEGSVSIETTTISQNYLIRFDNGTNYDLTGATTLGMFLNLKGIFGAAQELTAQFLDGSNNPLGNEVILSFDKNLVGTYQFVALGISSFGLVSPLVRKLQIAFRRTRGATTQDGFFLDVVKIQEGVTVPPIASDFLSLTDTPNSYLGQAGNFVSVNSGENGLQFVSGYPEATERANNTVLFDKNYIIGNAGARTGNILFDFTGAKLGAWTEMKHLDAGMFTFPAEAVLMFDSADISTTDDNYFLFVLTKKSSTEIVKVFHAIEGGV
jgi:hypothetical protein